jgi:predicted phosphodiesterase
MKFLWATDLHLIDSAATDWSPLLCAIEGHVDGIIVTGDIAESDQLSNALRSLAGQLAIPVYFVLGNHDFYGSSIASVTSAVIHQVRDDDRLCYLTDSAPIKLAEGIFLIGDDGWGDATCGNYESSYVRLNDFNRIDDFCDLNPDQWKAKLVALGQQSADRLSAKLEQIPTSSTTDVLIATHVPPYCEACWYQGKTTDDNWAPFFVCGAIGRVLTSFADRHRTINLTVICGHTHHDGVAKISDNLIVYTGAATEGRPEIEAEVAIDKTGLSVKRMSTKR